MQLPLRGARPARRASRRRSAAWRGTIARRPSVPTRREPPIERPTDRGQSCAAARRRASRSRPRHSPRSPSRPRRPRADEAPTPSGGASASATEAPSRTRDDVRARHQAGHRLAQPVRRRRSPRRSRHTSSCTTTWRHRAAPRTSRPQPALAETLGDLRRRQDLDVPHPPGRQVVRRPAGDRQGRGLHVPAGDQRRDGERPVRQLRHHDHEGHRDRRLHRRLRDHASPAPACCGWRCRSCPSTSGRTSTRKSVATYANDKNAGRQRPVPADRGAQRAVLPVHRQQEVLGRRAEDRRAGASGSSPTTRRWCRR